MEKSKNCSISSNATAYIESEQLLTSKSMQTVIVVDEKTGETCVQGYDSENKMKVTLLFQTETAIDTEAVVIETLKRSFLERIKKESA